jgi:hypothetical protein
MSILHRQSSDYSRTNQNTNITKFNQYAVVEANILDAESVNLYDFGGEYDDELAELFSQDLDTSLVGYIVGKRLDGSSSFTLLKPFNSYIIEVPLVGEIVEVFYNNGLFCYKRIYTPILNFGNSDPNRASTDISTSGDYKSVRETGITNTQSTTNKQIGLYFKPQQTNILKLYEGDTLIQSRFGQSIRFSAYNNPDNEYSPTILIRNKQNEKSVVDNKLFDIIEEDINRDGSTILMASEKYKIDFRPGVLNDNNKTNFKTTAKNFKLPQEYVGDDQILLNSDRIILSSKAKEMIFFSKGDYGFISDGKFIVDNGIDGAEMDFNGDVNIRTNNYNFSVDTGNTGTILLNTENENEAIVRGNTLVDLLEELIDAINNQIYQTPAGPTAPGPTNRPDFISIKSRLRQILSTKNFTE